MLLAMGGACLKNLGPCHVYCQALKKKQYFSLQRTRKQYQKGWKRCSTKQITMQYTPSKQENNTTITAHKTENQPFLPQFCRTFHLTREHISHIIVFGISFRFRICQNFMQHFSESRDFVQNVKHAHYPKTASEGGRSRRTT